MQGAVGSVTIDGKVWNQVAFRPVIPIGKFGVALDIILYIDAEGNIHKDEWDFSDGTAIKNTLIDKIYYIRYGHPGDPLYGRIGALDYVNLGYGILVDGYRNTLLYPQERKVGLDFSVRRQNIAVEGFVNDFKENLGLVGVRVRSSSLGGFPLAVSAVMDRNQYLGLRDGDDDGRPDLVDDFPDNSLYWLDSDHDGWADSDPLEWDIDGDGITDTLGPFIPGFPYDTTFALDTAITRAPEPVNIHQERNPVGGFALDIGYPIWSEKSFQVSVYAQMAKLIGETTNPATGDPEPLGMGIVPFGLGGKAGPVHVNVEYRMSPAGRFEFGYWNQSYQVERATLSASAVNSGAIITKEYRLGTYGKQKGVFARLQLDLGQWVAITSSYQNLSGERWKNTDQRFVNEHTQNFLSTIQLNKTISRLQYARAYYQQRNVPNPFAFEVSESTVLGYRLGLKLGGGMVLSYNFQRSFRDLNGDGDVYDAEETINLTQIETTFNL